MPSNTLWGRDIAVNITKHIKEISEGVLREFPVFAMIEARGNMLYNQGGNGFDWRHEFKLPEVTGNTGENPRVFTRFNPFKIAELEYRGRMVTNTISKKELLANRDSESKIIDLEEAVRNSMIAALKQDLARQPYKDGEASGNEDQFHGAESFMGTAGTINSAATAPSFASRSKDQSDLYANPSDTYANLSTAIGTYGGSQISGIWPAGDCDEEADTWTPGILIYDSTHSLLGSGSTFADQGVEAIRTLRITLLRNNPGMEGEVDMGTLDRTMFNQLLNQLDGKERFLATAENGLRSFGFKTVVEVDGIEITTDYGCPVNAGYLWNLNFLECRSMQDSLIASDESEWDIDSQKMKYVADVLANFKFKQIRCFGKLIAYADVTTS